MTQVLWLLLGLALGSAGGWFLAASRSRKEAMESAGKDARIATLDAQLAEVRGHAAAVAAEVRDLREALASERESRVRAETQLDEERRNLAEQKALVESSQQSLSETFKALSTDALRGNSEAFLAQAHRTLEAVLARADGELGRRREAIEGMVRPLADALVQYQGLLREVEARREKAYGGLSEQLSTLARAHGNLEKETANLVAALRKPQARGKWGEMTLRRVVELAQMTPHCDFSEQVTVQTATDESAQSQRPDMIVHLPGGRQIVVDAKVALEAYMSAIQASTEEDRQTHLRRHAAQMRAHVRLLAARSYQEQFQPTPDLVVMFVPGESFLAAALDQAPDLLQEGMEKKVVLATPTTLNALLRAIAYGWRQEQIAENAQRISNLGKDLHDRLRVLAEHLGKMGRGLKAATDAYNSAVGSFETRVFPAGRKFKDLDVGVSGDIPEIGPVETTPRALAPFEALDGGEGHTAS